MTWHWKHVKTHQGLWLPGSLLGMPPLSLRIWAVPICWRPAARGKCGPWAQRKGAVERVDCEVGQKVWPTVWHPAKVRKYPFLRVSWMKRWAEGEVGVSLATVCKTWRVQDYIEHHTHRIHVCSIYIWQHLHLPSIYPQCWHIYQHHGSYGS